MHETCNVREKPFVTDHSLHSLDRLAPADPLFEGTILEEPRRHGRPRRKPVRTALAKAVAAAALVTGACADPSSQTAYATDAVLVGLAPGAMLPPVARVDDGSPPIQQVASVAPADSDPILRVAVPAGQTPDEFARTLASQPGVEMAEPITLYSPSKVPNDSRYKDLWGMKAINVETAWGRTVGDRAIAVAVIDDGVAMTHSDLAPNIWVNAEESTANGRDDDGDGYVDDVHGWDFVDNDAQPGPAASGDERWHGSHVSGTIGAVGDNRAGVVGVNWKVSIMALRAIGPSGGRSDDLARAIDYAVDHGARVINASWGGGGTSEVIQRAVARAAQHGVLFVAAAGNDGASRPGFPANLNLANVISVGALDTDGSLASFSNRGAMVTAPGVGILSTTSPGQYARYDGTSMATPHVAGAAALLWSARPDATLSQVKKALLEGATGAGKKIDVAKAMDALLGTGGGSGPQPGAPHLSRTKLDFVAASGKTPRAQTITVRVEGGGSKKWTAKADAGWIQVAKASGDTPARLTIRANPAGLSNGSHTGHVSIAWADQPSAAATLDIGVRVGSGPAIAVEGPCSLRDDAVHVPAGSSCAISVAGLLQGVTASSVQWRLPGGEVVQGGRWYGRFVRRGTYDLQVSASEQGTDGIAVVVE
ncbi:MAG: S8 family serine peptidase [Myxococcales bacterium]